MSSFRSIPCGFLAAATVGACSLIFDRGGASSEVDANDFDSIVDASPGQVDAASSVCFEAPAPMHCLHDEFRELNNTFWNLGYNSTMAGVAISADRLHLSMSPNANDGSFLETRTVYSLRNSDLRARIAAVPSSEYVNTLSILGLYNDESGETRGLEMICNGGYFSANVNRMGSPGWELLYEGNCDVADQPYWRISNSGTTVTFWLSRDGSNWTQIVETEDVGLGIDQLSVAFVIDNEGTVTFGAGPTEFIIDAVNP